MVRSISVSLICGIFSMQQTPSTIRAAGIIATAAFFAPLISTSPCSVVAPLITYFSNISTFRYCRMRPAYRPTNFRFYHKSPAISTFIFLGRFYLRYFAALRIAITVFASSILPSATICVSVSKLYFSTFRNSPSSGWHLPA